MAVKCRLVTIKCRLVQASTDEDGRPRTVNPSMWTTDQNLGSDRQSHGQIRTLDQACNFIVDEWTDFFYHGPSNSWTESDNRPRLSFWGWRVGGFLTVHSMNGFGRRTIKITTWWTEVDEWTGERMKQTDGWPTSFVFMLSLFPWRLYSINGLGLGKFEIRVEGEF